MELLETNSPKGELIKKSSRQREALEKEIEILGDQTEKILINALIVGGSLALTYFIVRQFTSKSRSKSKNKKIALVGEPEEYERGESRIASIFSEVGTVLATQATAFLLGMAKEKLADYLETQNSKNKNKDEHS
jgi:hypothetical protein